MDSEKKIYFKNRAEWRKWLEKNHERESKIAVLSYKKHTGRPSMTHHESMEEAICFGWIDTTLKRIDGDTYLRRFAKRGKNSRWSNATLGYAKKLAKEGKMVAQGIHYYKQGLKKPTLDSEVSANPVMSEELRQELKKVNALEKFEAFAPSYKRMYLRWIERGKLAETRKKRIDEVVRRSVENKKKWTEKV